MSLAFFRRHDVVAASAAGVAYGVVAQLVVRLDVLSALYGVMSLGYIFVLPCVLGAITTLNLRGERRLLVAVGASLLTATLCLGVALAVGWEGSICLVMAAPVYLPLAMLSAIVTHYYRKRLRPGAGSRYGAVALLASLPLLSAGAERAISLPHQARRVHNSIDIDASATQVWRQIVRVPPIHEPQQSWFFSLGFPRPVEATLSHERVGGVRHARFERGLLFIETIRVWQPEQALRFGIEVDPSHTPLTTLDAHVTVGGRYFDVLEGGYRIEPLAPGRVRLHLDSHHRISTRFNAYTALWSDALMAAIQENILRVLKQRAERGTLATH